MAEQMNAELTQAEIDQRVFDLYDEYCHGRLDRREFLPRASVLTVGGSGHGPGTAAALRGGPDDLLH